MMSKFKAGTKFQFQNMLIENTILKVKLPDLSGKCLLKFINKITKSCSKIISVNVVVPVLLWLTRKLLAHWKDVIP